MMLYTFRTAPFIEKLLETHVKVFVFGRMKEDFEALSRKILEEKPDFVIGMAAGNESKFESKAINQFNGTKKVVQDGEPELYLHVPEKAIFPLADKGTDSFCNWTAYKIAKLIKDNELQTKLIFVHLENKDVAKFLDFITEL